MFCPAVVLSWAALTSTTVAQLVNSEWNTGNGNWNVTTNWAPNDVPDNGGGFTYNVQIGNRPVAAGAQVTFVPEDGTSDTVSTFTVSNGADFFTNGNQLFVVSQTTVDGAGSTIRVDPHTTPGTASLQALDIDLNNGGGLTMAGGIVTVAGGQLEINAGSVLGGHGTVNVGDADLLIEQAFENSGLLQPQSNTAAPQTLTIHANGVDTIDLDGDSETGVVDVDNVLANVNADTVTLVIDGPLSDPFGGVVGATLQIGQRDTLTFTKNFAIAANAAISMNGGNNIATLNGAGDITDIQGAAFTIANAALISNDMTFSGTANTITIGANSSLELGGTVTIPDASALVLASSTSQLIVSGATTINEAAGDFNWDGTGISQTTVKGTGQLTLIVNRVDTTDDLYGGTLTLADDGDVSVNNTANVWTMAGTLNKVNSGTSTVGGDAVNVAGTVNVSAGLLSMPVTTLSPGANVTVNGVMLLGGGSTLAGPTSIGGTGNLRMAGTSTVTASTTINTNTFDWDGSGSGTLHTINNGVVFTINSSIWDPDDAGDMDDPINVGGNGGTLAVNNVPSWTMTRTLTTNTSVAGITSLNGNSRMILSGGLGIWNANGQTAVNAPVTFGASSTANIAAAGFIRLNGGDGVSVFNRIEGGVINGPGQLVAINNKELRGFGTINAPIAFQNTSKLLADDGTLTINGSITDVGTIGTSDFDGVLKVVNAWNSGVADNVVLNGGVLQGGAITVANASGIIGHGFVTSRVINNTKLAATDVGSFLTFETAANNNDWDGAGAGVLSAANGSTLELSATALSPAFPFLGSVQATSGSRVLTNNFALNFQPGSSLNLTGSTYESTSSTDLGGTVTVGVGGESTIKVQNNFFLTFETGSSSTLNGNLRLENNNINIEAGAAFSGTGALVIPDGSHVVLDNGANVNVLLANDGALRPGNFDGIGAVTVKDYQQGDTGELYIELAGTLLNQFDRVLVAGNAVLDGYLNLDIDGGFVPALGNTFDIISSTFGVSGTFDTIDVSGMPAGLAFHVDYLPNAVRVTVVNKPNFSADFDDDGDVDSTDLAIWRAAYDLNQLGDANGDNITDGADFMIWQREFGSKPAVAVTATVPEPSGVILLLIGSALLAASATRGWKPRLAVKSLASIRAQSS